MLWAIASYFNPAGFRSRRENFRVFRERLGVPLVVVELSNGGPFELGDADADVLLQLREESVLWQKERLINVALRALPASCREVAWLDCDVVFAREDWHELASEALRANALAQPFRSLRDLPRGTLPEQADGQGIDERRSIAFLRASGDLPDTFFRERGTSVRLRYSAGHAWVGRREILDACGLYDAAILGSGNKLMLAAACGSADDAADAYGLAEGHRRHYLDWASRFHELVQGRIGWTEGTLDHLWHGELGNRGYGSRHDDFRRFGFDPTTDVDQAPSGAWRWSSDKPEMHRFVASYFHSRREDG